MQHETMKCTVMLFLAQADPCAAVADSTIKNISRVPDQNGVCLLYIMLEIDHSGREPSNYRDG